MPEELFSSFFIISKYIYIGGIMRLSDLQNKDVINTLDGKLIGRIIDVLITSEGQMTSLIIEKSKFIIYMFTTKDEIEIKWNNIDKIGEDVILVSLTNI